MRPHPNAAVEEAWRRLDEEGAFNGLHPVVLANATDMLTCTDDPDQVPGVMRYARALDMEAKAHQEWVDAGSPAIHKYPNGMVGTHPLMKIATVCAKHARDMGKAAGLWNNGSAWRSAAKRRDARADYIAALEYQEDAA